MKTLWGLLNTVEIFVYLRYHIFWPAIVQSSLDSMHQAMTYEFAMKELKAYYFGLSDMIQNESDLEMQFGIQADMLLYFGTFAVILVLLILLSIVYHIASMFKESSSVANIIYKIIKKKLFYNGWNRYFI